MGIGRAIATTWGTILLAVAGCSQSSVDAASDVDAAAGGTREIGSGGHGGATDDAATTIGSGGTTEVEGGPDGGVDTGADGGVEGGADAGTGDCIDFSHAETSWGTPRDLRIDGTGFEAYDGNIVRLVITNAEPPYALAQTAIAHGAFEFVFPAAVGNYTGLGVYIDEGRDDACTLGVDPSFKRTTGGDTGPVTWKLTPDWPPPSGDAPCSINGIFDLTKTLHCPG